jgi:hypothetical protein
MSAQLVRSPMTFRNWTHIMNSLIENVFGLLRAHAAFYRKTDGWIDPPHCGSQGRCLRVRDATDEAQAALVRVGGRAVVAELSSGSTWRFLRNSQRRNATRHGASTSA